MLELQNMNIAELEAIKTQITKILKEKTNIELQKLKEAYAGKTLSTNEVANILQCSPCAVYKIITNNLFIKEYKYTKKKVTKKYVNVENPHDTMFVTKECTYYTIME